MENVIAFLLLVLLSLVSEPAPHARKRRSTRARSTTHQVGPGGRLQRVTGSCESVAQCASGYACRDGVCAPS
jgi:hypothetical protein